MNPCISYKPRFFEYFVPSPIIFQTLCLSYDRTELFIMSFVRLIMYIILFFLIAEFIDYDDYPLIKNLFYVMFGINILYIGIVTALKPVFSLGANETISSFNERMGNLTGTIPYSI